MDNNQTIDELQRMMRSAVDETVLSLAELKTLEDEAYDTKREELKEEVYGVQITRHYELTLAGGGPSMWIEGELDDYGEPQTAEIKSNWMTGIQELRLTSTEEEALLEYASLHYFGE